MGYVHKLCGKDGQKLADIMWSIASNIEARDRDRIEAGKWLGDRGWNKAPQGIYFTDESRPLLIDSVNESDIEASRARRDDPDAD